MTEKSTLNGSPQHDPLPAVPLTVYLLSCWSRPDAPLAEVYGVVAPKQGDWFQIPDNARTGNHRANAVGCEPTRDPLDPTVWYVQVVRADPEPDAAFYPAMEFGR